MGFLLLGRSGRAQLREAGRGLEEAAADPSDALPTGNGGEGGRGTGLLELETGKLRVGTSFAVRVSETERLWAPPAGFRATQTLSCASCCRNRFVSALGLGDEEDVEVLECVRRGAAEL